MPGSVHSLRFATDSVPGISRRLFYYRRRGLRREKVLARVLTLMDTTPMRICRHLPGQHLFPSLGGDFPAKDLRT